MEYYYFYKAFRKTTIGFLSMFNSINIERYDIDGNVKGQYLVPLRYGPKTKAYLWVKDNSRNEEMLPMMSVYITGIDFDVTRYTNKHQDVQVSTSLNSSGGIFARNAVPYNITFTLNIWTLNIVDVDQIYEQILPYFTPHAFFRVRIPELDLSYDVKVILQSCSPVMTDDMGEEEARVIKWDSTFLVQAWLFKPVYDVTLIQNVIADIYTDEGNFDTKTNTKVYVEDEQGLSAETIYIQGI